MWPSGTLGTLGRRLRLQAAEIGMKCCMRHRRRQTRGQSSQNKRQTPVVRMKIPIQDQQFWFEIKFTFSAVGSQTFTFMNRDGFNQWQLALDSFSVIGFNHNAVVPFTQVCLQLCVAMSRCVAAERKAFPAIFLMTPLPVLWWEGEIG